MRQKVCATCGKELKPHDNGKHCSPCKYAKRPRKPCADCGGPTAWPATDKRAPAESRCRACQRANPRHGNSRYAKGCRCSVCKEDHRIQMRKYVQVVIARDGVSPSKKYSTPEQRKTWISPARRLALYERDQWVCQICLEPVDRTVTNGRMAPSLDHIIPRSHSAKPDHSDENLRTAHMSCNAARGNRIAA